MSEADAVLEEANRRAHRLARADLAVRDAEAERRCRTPGTVAIYEAMKAHMDAKEHRDVCRREYEEAQ